MTCDCHQKLGPGIEREQEMERNAREALDKLVENLKETLKRSNMVRAKFQLSSVKHYTGTSKTYEFFAVYDTSTEENARFTKYTPSGTLTITVDNPAVETQFELGKYYYLDFTEVTQATQAA